VLRVKKLLPAAGCNKQTEDKQDRFLDIYKKYLANSLYSLISKIISLLAYSKHAALNKGNTSNAY
jgi:hypothetical protein